MEKLYYLFPVSLLIAAAVSAVSTRYIRNLAFARGWALPPVSERHIHQSATPRLGGVAVFASFGIMTAALLIALRLLGYRILSGNELLALLGPAALLFCVGLFDDFLDVTPLVKLFFQACAGIVLSLSGYNFIEVHSPLSWINTVLGAACTVAWVSGITNAVNIIDGIDGLAGGSTLLSFGAIAVVAMLNGKFAVALLAIVLVGCLLGFLRFNFHPATIFLGDGGSMFLGSLLSALTIASRRDNPSVIVAQVVPILLVGFPIVEMLVSILRRFVSGKRIFGADREHIHHRLLESGLTQHQVVAVLYCYSGIFCAAAVLLLYANVKAALLLAGVVALAMFSGLHFLEYVEFRECRELFYRLKLKRRTMANNVTLRALTKKLDRCSSSEEIRLSLTRSFRELGGYECELMLYGGSSYSSQIRAVSAQIEPWSLDLNLRSDEGSYLGCFKVFGTAGRAAFDVNLLFEDVSRSLSAAIVRVDYARATNSVSALAQFSSTGRVPQSDLAVLLGAGQSSDSSVN